MSSSTKNLGKSPGLKRAPIGAPTRSYGVHALAEQKALDFIAAQYAHKGGQKPFRLGGAGIGGKVAGPSGGGLGK